MLEIIQLIQDKFSESQMSEFAHDLGSIGYENIMSTIKEYKPKLDYTDMKLIRKVFKRDCEIHGW